MELKDRLKEWRIKNELTQEKAAEKLKVAPQTVSKWERGILAPDVSLIPRMPCCTTPPRTSFWE